MNILRKYIKRILSEQKYRGTSGEEVFAILTKSPLYYSEELKSFRASQEWTDDFEKAKKVAILQSPESPYVLVGDENGIPIYALDVVSGNKVEL